MEFRDAEDKIREAAAEAETVSGGAPEGSAEQRSGEEIGGPKEGILEVETETKSVEEERAFIEEEIEAGQIETLPAKGKKKSKSKGKVGKVIAWILVVLLSAGAGFGGGVGAMYWVLNTSPNILGKNVISINPASNINTAEAIAEKVIPSVVGISTTVTYQSWFGQERDIPEGVGTGIVIDEKGYILTNSHVVGDGSTRNIIVQLTDGREISGSVLWNDRNVDLAIVKIDAVGLTAAELGDSEEVKIGSYAVAIGNPLGLAFDRSVTQGVISGLNRTITVGDAQGSVAMDGLLQTDASINSGNSGGPLLNSKGEVIGINSAKATSGEGLGFAIPINVAKPIVEQIKSKGEFTRAYIGIKGGSVSDYLASYPDAKLSAKSGVLVAQMTEGSPAAKAGLKVGDIIVGVNDKKIETMNQLISTLYQYRPGEAVKLQVSRDLRTFTVEVTLEAMSE